MEIKTLLDKWRRGELDKNESLALIELLSKHEGEEDFFVIWEKEWESSGVISDEVSQDDLLNKIKSTIDREISDRQCKIQPTPIRKIFPNRYAIAAAAAIVLLLVSVSLWFELKNQPKIKDTINESIAIVVYRGGQVKQIVLPDGSRVWLNAGSKLIYNTEFSDSIRGVSLEGEAFFDIATDSLRPFEVRSGSVFTRVLGTSFNIRAYGQETVEVSVATGIVRVSHPDFETVSLTPGKQLRGDPTRNLWETRAVDIENLLVWREGKFVYDGIPLGKLAPELERKYNVSIIFEDSSTQKCKINGKPGTGTVWELLDSYKFISGVEYKLNGDGQIVLFGGNCK